MCAPSTEDTHVYWQLPECLVLLSAYALTTLWHRSHLGSFPEPSIGTEELSTSHDGNFSSLGAVEHMLEHVGVVEWSGMSIWYVQRCRLGEDSRASLTRSVQAMQSIYACYDAK